MTAAPICWIGSPFNQAVALHARKHLRHRWLPDLCELGEIPLRAGNSVLQRDQHWQLSNAESKRFKT
jgi:hypothetical protein